MVIVVALIGWNELGPIAVVSLMLAGLLLGLYVEHRARKRRDRTDTS